MTHKRELMINKSRIKWHSKLLRNWQLWVMVLPALAYIIIFNYIPIYGIQLAFRDFKYNAGSFGGDWAGLKYFKQYFSSPMFWPTLRNTFMIAFSSIVFGFPMPIILALVINQIRNQKRKKMLQTTVYLPYFISTVVLVAIMIIFLSPTSGIISKILNALHLIGENANLMGDPQYFIPVYVISGIWQTCGWNSIIYVAALSSVDSQLYDAAKIDGANRWRVVWHIEIPAIVPTIIILLIMNMGNILSVGFEKTYLMQNSLNKSVSEVISTYVFNIGIMSSQFSFGAAVGLFNVVINFTFIVLANTIAKRTSDISVF